MTQYKVQPAVSAKDKDVPEIMIIFAALGLTLGGVGGWFLGGVMLAILGAIGGGLIGGFIAFSMMQRVNNVSKNMQMNRETQ